VVGAYYYYEIVHEVHNKHTAWIYREI